MQGLGAHWVPSRQRPVGRSQAVARQASAPWPLWLVQQLTSLQTNYIGLHSVPLQYILHSIVWWCWWWWGWCCLCVAAFWRTTQHPALRSKQSRRVQIVGSEKPNACCRDLTTRLIITIHSHICLKLISYLLAADRRSDRRAGPVLAATPSNQTTSQVPQPNIEPDVKPPDEMLKNLPKCIIH